MNVAADPFIALAPAVAVGLAPPGVEITPDEAVIVLLSTLQAPKVLLEHCGIAGAASERIAVDAEPFTADVPIVAVGSAKVTPPVAQVGQLMTPTPVIGEGVTTIGDVAVMLVTVPPPKQFGYNTPLIKQLNDSGDAVP
jgi:hypothetical protein